MDRKSILRGIILGIAAPLLVALLFTAFMINPDVGAGLMKLKRAGQLDTVLRIGLLANLVFFMLIVRKNEFLARGLVLSTLVLLTISLFMR